jgi:hypothetical protein
MEDPILHRWLKFQRNIKQTYDCPGFNFKIFIDSVEDYARQWEKREKEDLDTLSEWVKSVRSLIQIIIKRKLSGSMSTR